MIKINDFEIRKQDLPGRFEPVYVVYWKNFESYVFPYLNSALRFVNQIVHDFRYDDHFLMKFALDVNGIIYDI